MYPLAVTNQHFLTKLISALTISRWQFLVYLVPIRMRICPFCTFCKFFDGYLGIGRIFFYRCAQFFIPLFSMLFRCFISLFFACHIAH